MRLLGDGKHLQAFASCTGLDWAMVCTYSKLAEVPLHGEWLLGLGVAQHIQARLFGDGEHLRVVAGPQRAPHVFAKCLPYADVVRHVRVQYVQGARLVYYVEFTVDIYLCAECSIGLLL